MTGIDKVLRKNMAITKGRDSIVLTSVSSQELSGGNGGECENGQEGNTSQKKRRLSVGKAKLLEKYFEMDSKLEPERKMQLSQVLDIHPRQVAVWFQNRRARSKTKTLQTEYDALKLSYLNLKSDYQGLLQENQNLMSELEILKKKLGDIGQDVYDEEIEEEALRGRFPSPSVPGHQQFLRLEDSFLQSERHSGFPDVEDQEASVGLSWWGAWP